MDPAYIEQRRVGPEFDIFSLGVIITQLCMDEASVAVARHVTDFWWESPEKDPGDFLFPEDGTLRLELMEELFFLGLECSRRLPHERPTVSQVFQALDKLVNNT